MSVAVYIRVSSTSQNTASQKADIQRWLKGHRIPAKSVQWFEDKESGKTLNRDRFKALQLAISCGEVETIVVWKFDRIARTTRDGVNTIHDWIEKGIRVVSVTQQIDVNDKIGQFVATLLFGLADIEHAHIRERQASGIANAKKNGIYKGRKSGTTKGKPERARELKKQGLKWSEIAQAMGISERTVSNYLRNIQA